MNKTMDKDNKPEQSTSAGTNASKAREQSDTDNSACQKDLSDAELELRQGRKSLITPSEKKGKNKLRYIEGTTQLKDGCWLSD